jgi:hypothetical protein
MDKKEIYEHLAKIYLDASSKKKKTDSTSGIPKNILVFGVIFIFLTGGFVFYRIQKFNKYNTEIALVLLNDAAKINFNFDPAKKEILALDLKQMDLMRFKTLTFSVKKKDFHQKVSLRVEFTNSFRESSEIYFRNISHKWEDYKINLSNFRKISDWSRMTRLSFIVEEWNTKDNSGVVYIDNVKLIK